MHRQHAKRACAHRPATVGLQATTVPAELKRRRLRVLRRCFRRPHRRLPHFLQADHLRWNRIPEAPELGSTFRSLRHTCVRVDDER